MFEKKAHVLDARDEGYKNHELVVITLHTMNSLHLEGQKYDFYPISLEPHTL
jgi:hypothetical protein